jgi:putative component of membrane protein insertase Oxa1/YidC/SpoIIIJ protein YidD
MPALWMHGFSQPTSELEHKVDWSEQSIHHAHFTVYTYLSCIYLSIYLAHLYLHHLSTHLFIYLPIYLLSTSTLFIYLFIFIYSIYLSILSIYLFRFVGTLDQFAMCVLLPLCAIYGLPLSKVRIARFNSFVINGRIPPVTLALYCIE